MNINIHSIHFEAARNLLKYNDKKLKKLLKIDNRIISADVFLKLNRSESQTNKIIEIKINFTKVEFFTKR